MTLINGKAKANKVNLINHTKLANIDQGPNENPTVFLDQFKEVMQKYTVIDSHYYEGRDLLKDGFLTQSAPDMRKNFKKHLWDLKLPLITY